LCRYVCGYYVLSGFVFLCDVCSMRVHQYVLGVGVCVCV